MTSFCLAFFFLISTEKKRREEGQKKNLLQANLKSMITIFMSNTKHYVETLMKVLKCNHWLKFFPLLYKEIDKCFY